MSDVKEDLFCDTCLSLEKSFLEIMRKKYNGSENDAKSPADFLKFLMGCLGSVSSSLLASSASYFAVEGRASYAVEEILDGFIDLFREMKKVEMEKLIGKNEIKH